MIKALTDNLEQSPDELKQTLDVILRGEWQAEQAKKELVEANLLLRLLGLPLAAQNHVERLFQLVG